MNSTRLPLIAAMAVMLLMATAGAQVVSSVNNMLSITNLRVTPDPVVAGSNVTISFNLYNSYSDALSNVNLALQANNQLVNVSPTGSYLISSIGSGIYGGLGYNTFTYKFRAPPTLSAGLYTLDVVANYEAPTTSSTNLPGTSIMPITLYVYGAPQISFNIVPQTALVPGSTFSFQLATVNTGTDTASNVSVHLLSTNDFSMSGQTLFMLGSLAPGQSAASYASAIVGSNITSGEHRMEIYVSYSTARGNHSSSYGVPISISTGSPRIVVSASSAMPQLLYSGSNQTLTVLVQNVGTGTARNLTLSFGSTNQISVQSSASSFFMGSLAPGASATETITITANSSSSDHNSMLPVYLSYYTSNYQQRSNVTAPLPIRVAPSAVFKIVSVNDTLMPGSAYSPITLRIKNVGNEPAQEVSLSLQSVYPITPVAGNAYISYLAPGNETNVTFYVDVDQNGLQGRYLLTMYEQWRQANAGTNQLFTSSNNYYAVVYPNSSSSDVTGYALAVVAIVIIVVVARMVMKKRRGKKKEKQKQ